MAKARSRLHHFQHQSQNAFAFGLCPKHMPLCCPGGKGVSVRSGVSGCFQAGVKQGCEALGAL